MCAWAGTDGREVDGLRREGLILYDQEGDVLLALLPLLLYKWAGLCVPGSTLETE